MKRLRVFRGTLLLTTCLAAAVAAGTRPALAQGASTTVTTPASPFYGGTFVTPVAPGTKMLVESDQLVYDYDRKSVAAVGNVRIYYGQYTLTADRVTYDERSGRLVADGNVVLIEPNGTVFRSAHVDLTSNFRDAFVASLEVETPQRTFFSAERAERQSGTVVTFVNGVYTACEACIDEPQKPRFWNVKAATIVVDQTAQTISFTDARLEFFGLPVAYLPYFSIPDPSVQRKSGFLWPTTNYSERLGFSASIPYFWAIAPSYDLTITPAYYTRQGFLGEVEWRQRLANGQFSIAAAGIAQQDKDAFATNSASYRDLRGGIRTAGLFDINPSWKYGWDATLLSDRTFTRDYGVLTSENSEIVSTLFIEGLADRNYFEAHASAYQILTERNAAPASNPGKFDQGRQAIALPVVEYRRVTETMPGGATLTSNSNLTSIVRDEDDPFTLGGATFYSGTAGTTVRASQEVVWEKRGVTPGGHVVTPFASLRGDAFFLDANTVAPAITGDAKAFRAMPAAGVEWSYPLLLQSTMAAQIVEPKAQLILRPNEMAIGSLPNNDAQSLVYEVATLFDRNKFSGWDRNEGGGRLNVGVHYNATFINGAAIDGTLGQSFQVFGRNSFATADVAGTGPLSGLETTASDYVGAVALDTGLGPSVEVRGRVDEKTLTLNRAEVEATAALGPVTASAAYFYLRQNPSDLTAGAPASVFHGAASVNLSENWRAFGSFAYDAAKAAIASNSFGLAFDNSCVTFAVSYAETRKNYSDLPDRKVNFRLELRTLGQAAVGANLNTL
jgi:LPS-assembly protein